MRIHRSLLILAALLISSHASAQQLSFEVDESVFEPEHAIALAVYDEPIHFSVAGGFAHQFSSDLMTGDYNVSRFDFAVSAESQVNESWNVALTFRTLVDSYDFAPTASLGLGSVPWEDIYTLSFGARIQVKLSDKWKLSGGPVVQFSRESGADWSDAATAGGTISAIYQWNENLAVGLGIGAISQIEDDPLIVPIVTINWTITDTLRLSTDAPTATGVGAEIIWDFAPTWELAFGAGYSSKRFRLDNVGIAPGGVGEENYYPISLRLGWKPHDHVQVNVFGGFTFGTELTLETSAGARVTQEEPDGAMFAGFSARVQF